MSLRLTFIEWSACLGLRFRPQESRSLASSFGDIHSFSGNRLTETMPTTIWNIQDLFWVVEARPIQVRDHLFEIRSVYVKQGELAFISKKIQS